MEGGALANLEFRCLSCGNAFVVPAERIPPAGGKGKCSSCGIPLIIYSDGRIALTSAPGMPMATPAQPASLDEPIWEIHLTAPNPDFGPGPHRLQEVRRMVIEGRLFENDAARVLDGDWLPIRSYPAINNFFAEKVQIDREVHGDEDHCANHRDQTPGWRCTKCQNFLCKQCVVNRPVIAGGSANYLCAACESYTETLKGKGALKGLGGLFKKSEK